MSSGLQTVAVLGTGVMGSSVALFLARRGIRVVMFEREQSPFSGASRYNEGKIHLGFLYGADSSLNTARKLIPGGLAFPNLLHDLTDIELEPLITKSDDRYIIHRDSVVDSDQYFRLAVEVSQLAGGHPQADQYFVPLQGRLPRRISTAQLDAEYDTEQIIAGFEVPERSIATQPVADAFVGALKGSPEIEILTEHNVVSVVSTDSGRWQVETRCKHEGTAVHGPFDAVVNALWEDRASIDVTAGLPPPANCTHRYRVSLFARTHSEVNLNNAVVAIGPYGDIKNYDGRNLYLSWYKTGLRVEGQGVSPPASPILDQKDKENIVHKTLANLASLIPAIRNLEKNIAHIDVKGGWVYAAGKGQLDRIESELHRRDKIGIRNLGRFISVDTGKYSIAPWLARQLVDELVS